MMISKEIFNFSFSKISCQKIKKKNVKRQKTKIFESINFDKSIFCFKFIVCDGFPDEILTHFNV